MDKYGRSLTERLGRARLESRDISELIGICKGVLADGVISYTEALFILEWLEEHRIITDVWPAGILYQSLDNMLEDGVLDNDEEKDLLGLLVEITGIPIRVEVAEVTEDGVVLDSMERTLNTPTMLPVHEPESGLIFQDKNFVMTGKFVFGARGKCEAAVRERGGNTQKGVTKATNYLVVGEIGSAEWAHSSFGRKIEKAVYMREAGHDIYIVREQVWVDQLK